METKPILFLDFDGTISQRDAIDAILEKFADESWKIVEEKWKSGAIGSRECLREQVALVKALPGEINDLLDAIDLDEGFQPLLELCRKFSVPTYIISDGFDFCIRRILARAKWAKNIPIFSSHLEYRNDKWQLDFPYFSKICMHGCATCKPQVMENLNPQRARTIFVGDGLSDRYAAEKAELVFAKKSLAKFCATQNIRFAAYENLNDVAAKLEELLTAQDSLARPVIPFLTPIGAQETFS